MLPVAVSISPSGAQDAHRVPAADHPLFGAVGERNHLKNKNNAVTTANINAAASILAAATVSSMRLPNGTW
jgi:hypothetical protein